MTAACPMDIAAAAAAVTWGMDWRPFLGVGDSTPDVVTRVLADAVLHRVAAMSKSGG